MGKGRQFGLVLGVMYRTIQSLVTNGDRGPILIGADVTVGHNVRLGACRIGDNCLIGMGAQVGDGVVVEDGALVGARAYVEPGTVVKSGHILGWSAGWPLSSCEV